MTPFVGIDYKKYYLT